MRRREGGDISTLCNIIHFTVRKCALAKIVNHQGRSLRVSKGADCALSNTLAYARVSAFYCIVSNGKRYETMIRIISVRKATTNEEENYFKAIGN